jgi:hypothetical protein
MISNMTSTGNLLIFLLILKNCGIEYKANRMTRMLLF